ncbi:MAG: GNAT family N-acetyltransferase [Clostridia bacterium]|nr:GNAT family N-acetyltransferase [Clostridia bacterium]
MKKDKFMPLDAGKIKLSSDCVYDKKIRIIESGLMKKLDFHALVSFYSEKKNQFAAGEFFGKIIRAACVLYAYTKNEELFEKIKTTVYELLSVQGDDGEISTAPKDQQPNGSSGADLWERKYVMLGLLGYYDITGDENVKNALIKLLDYTISQVGREEGKTDILDTGWAFYGIESSSILEPVVKIYRLSGEKRHLDFASYIVDRGFCKRENVIDAILGGKSPYLVGDAGDPSKSIAKAYEMMSCFEGLTEYYRVTGIKRYRKAVLTLYKKLIKEEITELGSGGADGPFNLGPGTGEQWNKTRFEQANPGIELSMETCVTVTWMKLCLQLLRLEGCSDYADSIEVSAINALCAALRPDGLFYEYFPKFNGKRNPKVNFSYNVGGFDLSCCTANGPMGSALIPFIAFMKADDGPVINLYVDGKAEYGELSVSVKTSFPACGELNVTVDNACDMTKLFLRKPDYAYNYSFYSKENIFVSESKRYKGYYEISGRFSGRLQLSVKFDIRDKIVRSKGSIDPQGNGKLLLKHGPAVLTKDKRYTDINRSVRYGISPKFVSLPVGDELLRYEYGGSVFIDYQSAGATWDNDSEFVTWSKAERNDVVFRKAGKEDSGIIFAFASDLVDKFEDPSLDTDKIKEWLRNKIEKKIGEYKVILIKNKKAGYFRFAAEEGKYELDDLYILPEYRGQGIGSRVMEYCLEKADKPVFLYVFKNNLPAVRLYEKYGFREIESVTSTRMIMQKDPR